MTLTDRRKQLDRSRGEASPRGAYQDSPRRKPARKHDPAEPPAPAAKPERGPAATDDRSTAPSAPSATAVTADPAWVTAWATAYPATLSIGGQLKFSSGTADAYTGAWLYILDEAGNFVFDKEITRSTGDPTGRYLDNGLWCYGWWGENSYPDDQCFWWSGGGLDSHLKDGEQYYAWIFLKGTDGSWSPNGQTSNLVEAFYTPDIPGAQAGICSCYGQAHRADPVNTATGMFYEDVTDARLAGAGIPLSLDRHYRSDSTADGLLGTGWSTPFDAALTLEDGSATYRASDGARFVFTEQSDGGYATPPGAAATLAADDSGYVLTAPDRTRRTFDSSGRLTAWLDRSGHGLTLHYDSSGRLASVEDAAGRSTGLTLDSGGRLTEVALPDGSTVTYAYTDGLLTSVTDAAGETQTYGYDTQQRLTRFTGPEGGEVVNTYDDTGRITSQTDSSGETTTFAWEHGRESHMTDPSGGVWTDIYSGNVLVESIDPFGERVSYDYDRNLNPVGITDRRGHTTTMTYDDAGRMLTRSSPSSLGYTESWSYDAQGRIAEHTDGRGHTTTYTYTADGQLASATDPEGGTVRYTYTALGALESVTTPRGNTTTYGYDADGNRTSVTTPLGATTTFRHDQAGRITARTGPLGNAEGADPADHTTTYAYDARGLLASATDPLGRTTRYGYDGRGLLTSVTNPAGARTTYAYDAAGRLTLTTGPDGATTRRTYDAAGNLTSETDPLGNTTTHRYDTANRLVATVSPRGNADGADPADHTTTYGYDANGNRTSVTGPTGAVTTTAYDDVDRAVRVTDPLGNVTRYAYDAEDNLTRVTDALGHETTSAYDAVNRLTSTTDPLGDTTRFTYDADGNQLSRTTPLGHTTTWTYDAAGRQTGTTGPLGNADGADPAGFTTTYEYDLAGRQTAVTDPLGGTTATRYDAAGNLLQRTDPDGRTTSYAYDELDRLTRVTAPDGGTTDYTYDTAGNLVTRTDANGHTTSYDHDAAGRTTAVTDPLERVTRYSYDPDGNTTARTTPRGTTAYSHDPRGLLTGIDHSDATPDVSYTYDAAGRMTSRVNAHLSEDFTYDAAGNLTGTRGFSYTYDAAGQLLTRSYPDGTTIGHTYDADGRITAMTADSTTTRYDWDPAGHLVRTTLPSSATESRSYDAAGRLTAVTATRDGETVTGTELTLSPAGLPTRVDRTRAGGVTGSWDLTYDEAGRLASGCFPQPWASGCPSGRDTTYTYDQAGNRILSTQGSTLTSYAYDAADQLTSSTTDGETTTYGYDAEGNQTAAGDDRYTYDLAGRVSAATVDGTGYTYQHDASGNQLLAATGGQVLERTQWDPNAPLPALATAYDADGNVRQSYRYDPLGQPAATKTGSGSLFYYHHDPQGSPLDVTGANGTVHQRWAYDPYGTRILNTRQSGAPASTPSFTGARFEKTTGRLDLHARRYTPERGRFDRPDPVTPARTTPYVSAYAYAHNVPTLLTDRSGLTPENPNDDKVESFGEVLGIFGGAFRDVAKSPFVFAGDLYDAVTGQNGGAGAFADKYFPVRPAYRLYRAAHMLREQGCGALADSYDEAGDQLVQQLALTGLAGLNGWQRAAVNPAGGGRAYYGGAHSTRFGLTYYTPETPSSTNRINPEGGRMNCGLCATAGDDLMAGKNPNSVPGADRPMTRPEVEAVTGRSFRSKGGLNGVVADLQRWGPGARAIVGAWPRKGMGHYFNVVNNNGKIVFLDFQTGRANPADPRYTSYYLMRTDT
ncbi:RHS repeat protein [Streptomyces sp. JJ36]|nr:RHS repeat protein [Streptomyces sp. JJ36]